MDFIEKTIKFANNILNIYGAHELTFNMLLTGLSIITALLVRRWATQKLTSEEIPIEEKRKRLGRLCLCGNAALPNRFNCQECLDKKNELRKIAGRERMRRLRRLQKENNEEKRLSLGQKH